MIESVKSMVAPDVDVVTAETGPLFKMSENVLLGGLRGMQQEGSSTFRVYDAMGRWWWVVVWFVWLFGWLVGWFVCLFVGWLVG
jgi:hypothetical protein